MKIIDLTEDTIDAAEIKRGLIEIKHNCQPYLQAINYNVFAHPLFRGIKHENETVIKKSVRLDDRHPQDFDTDIHNLLNNYFTRTFGAAYRNAMFAAGSSFVSESFGDLYLVFPIGQFTFLWSQNVVDLQVEHGTRFDDIISNLKSGDDQYEWDSIEKYLDALEYQDTDLQKAIKSNNEIAFRCKEYYGLQIPVSLIHSNNIGELLHMATNELER